MDTKKNTMSSQDTKKIEKELSAFLHKKFGDKVKIISPSPATNPKKIIGNDVSKNQVINFAMKPKELIDYLDQYVVKQKQAKSVLATKICTHFNRIRHSQATGEGLTKITGNIKSNILMLGPTGIGKTYLIKLIAKKIGVPFIKADATKFSETGYVGKDVEDLIRDLVKEANDDIELAQCGIIYIDEIDKIAASPNVIGAQVSRTGVQRALLKPMEETEVDLKVAHDPVSMMQELEAYQRTGSRTKRSVNTSNILFIVSGAFSYLSEIIKKRLTKQNIGFNAIPIKSKNTNDLLKLAQTEDLVEFGFESEFIGRIPVRCTLETLSENDLYDILKMPNNPVILSKRMDFSAYGIKIVFDNNSLKLLSKRAYEENTGARGLVSIVEQALLDFEESLPSLKTKRLCVSKQLLENPEAYLQKLKKKEDSLEFKKEYEKAFNEQKKNIAQNLKENWNLYSKNYALSKSNALYNLIASYYCKTVVEIEDAVKKIKEFYDKIKDVEVEISKEYNLNIIFNEDAIHFLIEQFIYYNVLKDDILEQIHNNFFDGLNLIREKTNKNRFFISKCDFLNPETYLNNLIKKEIK